MALKKLMHRMNELVCMNDCNARTNVQPAVFAGVFNKYDCREHALMSGLQQTQGGQTTHNLLNQNSYRGALVGDLTGRAVRLKHRAAPFPNEFGPTG